MYVSKQTNKRHSGIITCLPWLGIRQINSNNNKVWDLFLTVTGHVISHFCESNLRYFSCTCLILILAIYRGRCFPHVWTGCWFQGNCCVSQLFSQLSIHPNSHQAGCTGPQSQALLGISLGCQQPLMTSNKVITKVKKLTHSQLTLCPLMMHLATDFQIAFLLVT